MKVVSFLLYFIVVSSPEAEYENFGPMLVFANVKSRLISSFVQIFIQGIKVRIFVSLVPQNFAEIV